MPNEELLSRIKLVPFPEEQYVHEETVKSMIFLHHTVSPGASVQGDLNYWLSTTDRIATHVVIGQDGTIHQCFNSKYWAYHLGCKGSIFAARALPYVNLDKISLSIELDSLGPVDKNGVSIAYGPKCTTKNITHYPNKFRGYEYYETYSTKQLESLKLLLQFWCDKFSISTMYNDDMWDMSNRALTATSGIWSHTSVRPDKSDVHPQQELIDLLKTL